VGASSVFRNWFTFDLSGAAGQTVISAQLVIPAQGNYLTDAGIFNLTYVVNDYVGSIAALVGGTAGVAGYTDLGNGPYGQTVVTVPSAGVGFMSSIGPNVTVTLNATALADLNTLLAGSVFDFALGCGSFGSRICPVYGSPTGGAASFCRRPRHDGTRHAPQEAEAARHGVMPL
jgi:hypothetical protein